jgi:hypothetical protein
LALVFHKISNVLQDFPIQGIRNGHGSPLEFDPFSALRAGAFKAETRKRLSHHQS